VTPPVFTLIAGANGAGKSTLTGGNPETFSPTSLLDPDSFARPLSPSTTSPIAAGREVLHLAKDYLERGESFTIETTLSGRNYLEMMIRARTLGFEVVLIYIGTEDVNINLSRIKQRVLGGGHDVPENDVRRRYKRSLDHLPVAVRRADHTLLFDNSTESAYQLVGVLSPSSVQWFEPLPRWVAPLRTALSGE
jgi:predicted ABC-type ATPase